MTQRDIFHQKIARVNYPGLKLTVMEDVEHVLLQSELRVKETFTGQDSILANKFIVSEDWSINQIVQFVRERLQTMILHELDENLKVDGEVVFNPHPHLKEKPDAIPVLQIDSRFDPQPVQDRERFKRCTLKER